MDHLDGLDDLGMNMDLSVTSGDKTKKAAKPSSSWLSYTPLSTNEEVDSPDDDGDGANGATNESEEEKLIEMTNFSDDWTSETAPSPSSRSGIKKSRSLFGKETPAIVDASSPRGADGLSGASSSSLSNFDLDLEDGVMGSASESAATTGRLGFPAHSRRQLSQLQQLQRRSSFDETRRRVTGGRHRSTGICGSICDDLRSLVCGLPGTLLGLWRMLFGIVLAGSGIACFCLQTKDTYWYMHSLWHLLMMGSAFWLILDRSIFIEYCSIAFKIPVKHVQQLCSGSAQAMS